MTDERPPSEEDAVQAANPAPGHYQPHWWAQAAQDWQVPGETLATAAERCSLYARAYHETYKTWPPIVLPTT